MTTIIPVILCGGSGTRLWPESREAKPKQFLKLFNEYSLLQNTVRRAIAVSGANPDHIVCVCLESLAPMVAEQLTELDPRTAQHILKEPSARNTAAAVAYAARYVEQTFGAESVMWILPSDHFVGREDALAQALNAAVGAAVSGALVTFGISPTRPETGYGYIKRAAQIGNSGVFAVESFVEKPDFQTAVSFLGDGGYLWNSGMFVFRTGQVIAEFGALAQDVYEIVAQAMDQGAAQAPDESVYGGIPKNPFDKAIMEKSAHVAVVPCDPAWSDVGTWESIREISDKDADGNATTGNVVLAEAKSCLVRAGSGRLVACAGVGNIVVIDTPDAVLVTTGTSSDPLKKLVEILQKTGRA